MIRVLCLIFSAVLAAPAFTTEQGQSEFREGQHYVRLPQPVRTSDPNKIDVVEVFSYGCGHCFKFEPLVTAWKKNTAEDVKFWRSPVIWNPVTENYARAYLTAQALNVLDRVHDPIFAAIHVEGKQLSDRDDFAAIFVDQGVNRDQFNDAWDSFAVTSQLKQAAARARAFQITGTPEIVVNGKYRVGPREAGSHSNMLAIVDYLVEKERAEAAGEQQQTAPSEQPAAE